MASPRPRHRRGSMELPPNMLSDIFHLKEELNRVHKDISLECNKYRDKTQDLINEFRNGYRLANYALLRGAIVTGGIAMVLSALSFFVIDDEDSLIFVAAAAAGMVVGAVLYGAFAQYRTKQNYKKSKRTIEENLKGFQDKINPTLDMLENNCQRTEEILRDLSLSVHTTQALSEHFSYYFEKRLFQEHDRDKVVSNTEHFSGKLSEIIAKFNSVPDILKEIIEDNNRQRDKPTKPTKEQINKREFKEKTEKFINDMQKEICELKNGVKQIRKATESLSNLFN